MSLEKYPLPARSNLLLLQQKIGRPPKWGKNWPPIRPPCAECFVIIWLLTPSLTLINNCSHLGCQPSARAWSSPRISTGLQRLQRSVLLERVTALEGGQHNPLGSLLRLQISRNFSTRSWQPYPSASKWGQDTLFTLRVGLCGDLMSQELIGYVVPSCHHRIPDWLDCAASKNKSPLFLMHQISSREGQGKMV